MTALEDIRLEEIRGQIGALVLLTQSLSPRDRNLFLKNDVLRGVLTLIDKGYAKREGENHYVLTDRGWVYARRVLDSVEAVL